MSTIDAPLVYVTQSGQIIPSGYTSSNLPQGPQGDKGDTGQQGDTGPQGLQGDKGDTGQQGLQGDTGLQGQQGDKGQQGLQGDKGDTGQQGLQGDTGQQGLQGDKGDTGDTGVKGDKGDTGPQGQQGDKGDTGQQGLQGERELFHQMVECRAGDQVNITVVIAENNPTADLNDISIVEGPFHGTIIFNGAGVLTYQADVRYLGSDWFKYEVGNTNGALPKPQGTVTTNIVSPMPPLSEDDGDKFRFIYAIDGGTRQVKQYNNGVTSPLFTPGGSRIANGLATNRDDNVVYYAWENEIWAYDYLRDVEFKVATISADEGPFSNAVRDGNGPTTISPYTGGAYHDGAYYVTGKSFSPNENGSFALTADLNRPWHTSDQYPWSLSMDINLMFVGDAKKNRSEGQVLIWEKNSSDWTNTQTIVSSDGEKSDYFGFDVSVDGDWAIVGASNAAAAGQGYIFKKTDPDNTWVENQILAPVDDNNQLGISQSAQFGRSVSMDSDYVIIGAPFDNNEQGSAFIFKKTSAGNWNQVSKCVPPDTNPKQNFGYSVSLSGDYAIVGANYGPNGSYEGSAYIFKNNGSDNWERIKTLKSDAPSPNASFGMNVSIDGNHAVIGCPSYKVWSGGQVLSVGAVFIYKNDGSDNWDEEKKITPNEGDEELGNRVSISENYIIVGARTANNDYKGKVSIYHKDTGGENNWGEVNTINGNSTKDYLGYAVCIHGLVAAIGSAGENSPGGALDIYQVHAGAGTSGYYKVVLAPYKRGDSPAEQKILDVSFIPWSDNSVVPPQGLVGNREMGDLAYSPTSGKLIVASNDSNNLNPNQIAICDPFSGKILHTSSIHGVNAIGPNNEITWDASGFIVLSQYDPTGLGSKIRSINTSTGIVGPVLRELEEENIGDLAEWISQKPTRTL